MEQQDNWCNSNRVRGLRNVTEILHCVSSLAKNTLQNLRCHTHPHTKLLHRITAVVVLTPGERAFYAFFWFFFVSKLLSAIAGMEPCEMPLPQTYSDKVYLLILLSSTHDSMRTKPGLRKDKEDDDKHPDRDGHQHRQTDKRSKQTDRWSE